MRPRSRVDVKYVVDVPSPSHRCEVQDVDEAPSHRCRRARRRCKRQTVDGHENLVVMRHRPSVDVHESVDDAND